VSPKISERCSLPPAMCRGSEHEGGCDDLNGKRLQFLLPMALSKERHLTCTGNGLPEGWRDRSTSFHGQVARFEGLGQKGLGKAVKVDKTLDEGFRGGNTICRRMLLAARSFPDLLRVTRTSLKLSKRNSKPKRCAAV